MCEDVCVLIGIHMGVGVCVDMNVHVCGVYM